MRGFQLMSGPASPTSSNRRQQLVVEVGLARQRDGAVSEPDDRHAIAHGALGDDVDRGGLQLGQEQIAARLRRLLQVMLERRAAREIRRQQRDFDALALERRPDRGPRPRAERW